MPITLDGSNGITTPMYNGSITANAVTPSVSMKNRIINGAMVIDQRNAGASVAGTNGNYVVDRFLLFLTQNGKLTGQQNAGSVTPPVGFSNYLGITSSSAYSVVSGDILVIRQGIEGFNIADLNWGTANAKTVTLSFWVRSSLTGTFGGSLANGSSDRSYPFSYTISAANTWEQKSITIAGDTTGTWATNNTGGIYLNIGLGVGSTYAGTAGSWSASNLFSATGATSVVGTNGATFYITGVQLEVGSTATSFDYRPYGTELALCQRYYYQVTGASGNNYEPFATGTADQSTSSDVMAQLPVTMRTVPTTSFAGTIYVYDGAVSPTLSSVANVFGGKTGVYLNLTSGSGLTIGNGILCYTNNATTNNFAFSAEL